MPFGMFEEGARRERSARRLLVHRRRGADRHRDPGGRRDHSALLDCAGERASAAQRWARHGCGAAPTLREGAQKIKIQLDLAWRSDMEEKGVEGGMKH